MLEDYDDELAAMLEFKGILDTAVTTTQAQPAASTMCSLEDLMEMDEGPPQAQGQDAQPSSEKARQREGTTHLARYHVNV